jgi:hypothetical protein
MVTLFSPHAAVLRDCVDRGASITLKVIADINGDVVTTRAEAERREYHATASDPRPFSPFFDAEIAFLSFDAEALRFLADLDATVEVEIWASAE